MLTLPAPAMDGLGDFTFASDARTKDGAWHHVTLTRSGTAARLYLDGAELEGSVPMEPAALDIDAGSLASID